MRVSVGVTISSFPFQSEQSISAPTGVEASSKRNAATEKYEKPVVLPPLIPAAGAQRQGFEKRTIRRNIRSARTRSRKSASDELSPDGIGRGRIDPGKCRWVNCVSGPTGPGPARVIVEFHGRGSDVRRPRRHQESIERNSSTATR